MDLRDQLQNALGDAYTLERELGGGGMSRVFVAEETRLKRKVVVKVLSPELAQGISVERFEREIQTAAALQQANIVPVLTAGDMNGLPFFTMPFVEGESLRARLARGPLAITEVIGVLRDVAKALSYAHGRNFVHRDIKPDNVLLSGGTAVVTDFGIAKALSASRTAVASATLTQMGTSIGTPAYMAPEQAAGDPNVDHRADIYSLGCLAYELLAGQPPFANRTPQRVLAAHMGEAPKNITEFRGDLPATLAELVMACLAKDAKDRPQHAGDIARVLETITSGSGMQAMPPVLLGGPGMFRKALAIYAAAFVAVAILAKAAIVGIGLPDWVFPGSLIVMALGLPVVLWTGYVQRVTRRVMTMTPTYTPGGSPSMAQGTIATMALKAAPAMSWHRTARGGAFAIGAFIVVIAAFMGMRALGIGPAASLMAAGKMKQKEPLLIADFRVNRVDTSVASVVTEAVRADLGQSTAITLVTPASLAAALQRMQRPTDSRIDLALGREIASREGIKAIVDGEVTALGSGFVIAMRLVSADSGSELWSSRATVDSPKELISAVDDISRKLRGKIGESLRGVQAAPPLEKVTTSSFEALRKYAEGTRASDVESSPVKAIPLLRESVALDSNFAMAWRKLAVVLSNAGRPQSEIDVAASRAFALRTRLPDAERLRAEAYYYDKGPGRDRARAVAAYEAALARGDSYPALNNAAILYQSRRDYARAETLLVASVRQTPGNASALDNLIAVQLDQGKLREAASSVELFRQRFPTNPNAIGNESLLRYAKGDPEGAQRVVDSARASTNPDVRTFGYFGGTDWAIMHGRLAEARRLFVEGEAINTSRGNPTPALLDSLQMILVDAWFGPGNHAASDRLDAALARVPFRSLPVVDRPYLLAAMVYAINGRADRAHAVLSSYTSEVSDTALRRSDQPMLHRALAEIALAEHRPKDAIDEMRQGDRRPDGPADGCLICFYGALARAYDASNQPDSAIVLFERYFSTPFAYRPSTVFGPADPMYAARAHERLGQLYETKGDAAKAAEHYRAFIDLWKNADAEFQPRVAEVRQRLTKLTPVEKPRQ
ncbi:MAG: protein kinase [Gemmatimonadales bacterium]